MPSKPASSVIASLISSAKKGRISKYEDLPVLSANEVSEFFALTQCNPSLWPKAAWPDAMLKALEVCRLNSAGFNDEACTSEQLVLVEHHEDRNSAPKTVPMIRTQWGMLELDTINQPENNEPSPARHGDAEFARVVIAIHSTKSWSDNEGLYTHSEDMELRLSSLLDRLDTNRDFNLSVEESGGVSLCEIVSSYSLPGPEGAIVQSRKYLAAAMITLFKDDLLGKQIEASRIDTLPDDE